MAIRIIIADDHQIVRDGLASLLEGMDKGLEVVGQAADGEQAVALAAELKPDIMLMDVAMPKINGIDATRTILANAPDTRIIAVTMHAERTFISGMLQAGAMGYIRKESAFEEISSAIESVTNGRVFLGEGIASVVVSDYKKQMDDADAQSSGASLTDRETQVLALIADGLKTKEIAAKLHVSDKTVETHRRQVSRKLDLFSVAELTKYAIRNGLSSVD